MLDHFLLCAMFRVLSSFAIIFDEEERVGCFFKIIFQMFCDCKCPVTLPRGAVGWSAVCDCSISWLYLFTFVASRLSHDCIQLDEGEISKNLAVHIDLNSKL